MRLRKFLVSSLLAGSSLLFGACAAHRQVAAASPAAGVAAPPCRGGVLIPAHAGPRGYWIGEHWDCPAVKGPGSIAIFTDPVPPQG
jgi:hypothetical protein